MREEWFFYGLIVFIVLLIGLLVRYLVSEGKAAERTYSQLISQGFEPGDLEAFHVYTGIDYKHILSSQAVRKYYDLYVKGESDFLSVAKNKKETEEAESRGRAVGIVTGIAVGSSIKAGK